MKQKQRRLSMPVLFAAMFPACYLGLYLVRLVMHKPASVQELAVLALAGSCGGIIVYSIQNRGS